MRCIWLRIANPLAALAIPFPNEVRIFRESFRCCQFGRIEIPPVAVLPTKCRDSTFGGNARACDYQNSHNSSLDTAGGSSSSLLDVLRRQSRICFSIARGAADPPTPGRSGGLCFVLRASPSAV